MTSIRLVTFNLLHGLPVLDGVPDGDHFDVQPLRAAIGKLDADVLALQEVDVHQPRSGGVHQVAEAAEVMGAAHWRFVPSVLGTPGGVDPFVPTSEDDRAQEGAADVGPRYGIGMASRLDVESWDHTAFDASGLKLPLLVPSASGPRVLRVPDEPRLALASRVHTPHGPVTIATAHLSFVPGVNARQLRALRAWLSGMPRPLVLLGDFNLPGRLPERLLGWQSAAKVATYPSYRPRVQFDHVLVDGLPRGAVERARATAQSIPLGVSDHCALQVDIELD